MARRGSLVKAGIEMSDGVPHVGAVVTNEFSDWSLAPVQEWKNRMVTIRASFLADALILRARIDKGNGGQFVSHRFLIQAM